MNIAVIGAGYVGLVTAACLAESGNRVICVDKDEEKIALLASPGRGGSLCGRCSMGSDRAATFGPTAWGHHRG